MLAALGAGLVLLSCTGPQGMVDITNDEFWLDTDSVPIFAQGGGVLRCTDPRDGEQKWFWYGVHYAEADSFVAYPHKKFNRSKFHCVRLYTSTDLSHWQREPAVLTSADVTVHDWFGRLGVTPLPDGRFALLAQLDSSVLICTATSPLGPFNVHREYDMTPIIGRPDDGDQSVFTDDDGKGYLVCSSGVKPNRTLLMQITVSDSSDSVSLAPPVELFRGEGRTGNCIFKYNNRYFLCASNEHDWDASRTFYLTAPAIEGPYKAEGDMRLMRGSNADYSHCSQTGFFIVVPGSRAELVMFCGERWGEFANNGKGFYVWLPLSFDPEGAPLFNSLSHWQVDATTGLWRVGPNNDFVKNGSFEANRYIIPNLVYNYKNDLASWTTEVISGRRIMLDLSRSPRVNRLNTDNDAPYTTGKMSLCISDSVLYDRCVSQILRPSRNVALPDGQYLLTASVLCQGELRHAELFAEDSEGNHLSTPLDAEPGWHVVELPVTITGGFVRIGFRVAGEPLSQVLADDVSFVRKWE